MISQLLHHRPIFAWVISAFIVIAGLAALRALPVAQYPNILPPEVTVQAYLSGRDRGDHRRRPSPRRWSRQINGVESMLYMRSVNSGNGALTMTVTFAIGTDPDLAAINVNNRVQAALPRLPEEVRRQGVHGAQAVVVVPAGHRARLRGPALRRGLHHELRAAQRRRRAAAHPRRRRRADFGSKEYSIRIWMQPDKLAQLGLTPGDVADGGARAELAVRGGPHRRRTEPGCRSTSRSR